MSVDEALSAVRQAGSPIVSIAGGEPTIHPRIDEIINTLVAEKYFVYCCTNGLLLERMLPKIPPTKYFSWVVHVDGMEECHDEAVARKGVFKKAIHGIELALGPGIPGLAPTPPCSGAAMLPIFGRCSGLSATLAWKGQ